RIKKIIEKSLGNTVVKDVQATHIFFDLIDAFQYGVINGTLMLDQCLSHALSGTGWTYTIADTFNSVYFDEYGKDNALALVQLALNEFGAEVEIGNKTVTIRKQIGTITDFQLRFKHNLKTISRSVDTSNLSTVIKGYGNRDEYGNYRIELTYRSPQADIYGERHAPPIYCDDCTTTTELEERLRAALKDTPEISFDIEFVELKNNGYPYEQINLGDTVYVIYEPLNIDITARVVELVEFPESTKSTQLTLANFKPNATDIIADFSRKQNELDKVAVKKREIYNGVTINDDIGIKVTAQNNVETLLNATDGIKITNNGIPVFFVDTTGNVTFDGQLKVTENGIPLLLAFMDTYGGKIEVRDINGNMNVKIGSESGTGDNKGGTIVLYDDGDGDSYRRVELGISTSYSAGLINLRDSNGAARVSLAAQSNIGSPYIGVNNSSGVPVSYLTETSGYINSERIATRSWVTNEINNAIAQHIAAYRSE
ncbi:phage tail protein, partial [Anoxybacillus sp. J5B_2022]|uniref:phage tail protein n=1 Tax=Anoxybacillus sp. J5B_2022 TaxID=3003246 RepID=UPI002285FCB9